MAKKGPDLWVVYWMTLRNHQEALKAVCNQREWDEMERAQPGFHRLVQAGIPSEGEAERLARGTSGDPVKRGAEKLVSAAQD